MKASKSLSVFVALASSAAAQSLMVRYGETVQAGNAAVPGLPGVYADGALGLYMDAPTIDLDGNVAFRTKLAGAGVGANNNYAYLVGRAGGDLQVAVRKGDPAPSCPGNTLDLDWAWPRLSSLGGVMFFPSTISPSGDTALFWGPNGSGLLARTGYPVPFLGGVNWAGFNLLNGSYTRLQINEQGKVLFTAALAGAGVGSGNDAILVTGASGSLQSVVREGDIHPSGGIVERVGTGLIGSTDWLNGLGQMNSSGQVLHDLKFVNGLNGITASNDRALAVWTSGIDTLIAREGDAAPGLPAGVVFADPPGGLFYETTASSFNNQGNVAFMAQLAGTGVTTANDTAIYLGGVGGLTLVARKGDAVPGLPGITYLRLQGSTTVATNNYGQVAFLCKVTGAGVTTANDTALLAGAPGSLSVIAREGDAVPGVAASYGQLEADRPYLTDRGSVLFYNTTSGGSYFFGYTPIHGVRPVLAPGDTVGAVTWAFNGIQLLGSSSSSDGTPGWFNSHGDFAMRLQAGFSGPVAIVRGHLGSFVATPSSIAATGGIQNWNVDAGVANAGQFYVVTGSSSGTRPGFALPGLNVPANYDWWLQGTLGGAGGSMFNNSIGSLDGQGRATAALNFPNFPGLAGLSLHHCVVLVTLPTLYFASEPTDLLIY